MISSGVGIDVDSIAARENDCPLCVDLDGTLLKTDLLVETAFALFRTNPLALFLLPFWLLGGRANLKRQIAQRVLPVVKNLPFRADLLEFLQAEKSKGRRIILVSAADQTLAERVQQHLEIFDEIIGSDGASNLKGRVKAEMLVKRFGSGGFDYIGDSAVDFAVWRVARRALVVTNRARFVRAINLLAPVEKVFPRSSGGFGPLLRALRTHQWAKNLLVFVPLVTSHKLGEPDLLFRGLLAFLSFSLICSSVYLLNDILDLEADRSHKTKRLRPIASGELSVVTAAIIAALLLLAGIAAGVFCGLAYLQIAAVYFVWSFAYSMWLKHLLMLDVVVLACFYTLRLLAGGAATGIGCSEWLLAFSVFFFFCLAMIKRHAELRELDALDGKGARAYERGDLHPVASFGVSSGMISVLVLVLYAMSPEVKILYRTPTVLLLLCPLLLYWITRLWLKAHRGEVPQDPVVFALTDRTSYITGMLAAVVLYSATL